MKDVQCLSLLLLLAGVDVADKPMLYVPEPPTWLLPLTGAVLFLFRPRKPR
jgi:hypothetical protein